MNGWIGRTLLDCMTAEDIAAAYDKGRITWAEYQAAIDRRKAAEQQEPAPSATLGHRYDYDRQAWTVDGRYVRCGHPETMQCGCYGREHEGEQAPSQRTQAEEVQSLRRLVQGSAALR